MKKISIAPDNVRGSFLYSRIFLLIRPKRVENSKEDYLALAGIFLLVLGFILMASLLLK